MTDRTDGTDPGPSSEELIRQARQPYDPDSMKRPDPGSTSEYQAGPPEVSPDAPEAPPFESRPSPTPSYTDLPRPADNLSWDRTSQPGQPEPAAPWDLAGVDAGPSFIQKYGKALLFAVVVLGFITYNVLDKTTDVDDLEVGDCLLMPEEDSISTVESIDCDKSHDLEVFALVTSPDSENDTYPGEIALGDSLIELCEDSVAGYVTVGDEETTWFIDVWIPERESWEDGNLRYGTCVLGLVGPNLEPTMSIGSARGG